MNYDLRIREKKWMQGDAVVWMILISLCIISLIEVYSASSRDSYKSGYFWKPVAEHGFYLVSGVIVTWFLHMVPCKLYKIFATFGLHIFAYPMLVWALFSDKINDAGRWITLPLVGRTFQPSELAKITLVGFVAFVLSTLRTKKGTASDTALKVVAAETIFTCAIIGTENLSTAMMIFAVIFMMLWIADANRKVLAITFLAGALGLTVGLTTIKSMSEETVQAIAETPHLGRFATWAHRLQKDNSLPENPDDYKVGDNQQVAHAQIAIATSNVVGLGPGKSVERDYLPMAFSDYIYAIIIEEGGIESAALVMFLYLLLIYRSWRIAQSCAARFPAYLVMGLSLMLVTQAMINMAVAVGAFPVTGQPLPLVSKGGTSTFITCAYIGMILSVSRSAKKIEIEGVKTDK